MQWVTLLVRATLEDHRPLSTEACEKLSMRKLIFPTNGTQQWLCSSQGSIIDYNIKIVSTDLESDKLGNML